MKSTPKKLLVIKNRNLGDAIIGLSSISWIKSVLPDVNITYAVPEWISPLFKKVKTDADEIFPFSLKSLLDYPRIWKWLVANNFDMVIELHQSGRTGKFFSFFSKLKQVPYYFHNHHDKQGSFILNQGTVKPAIQRDLDGVWSVVQHLYEKAPVIPNYLDWNPKLKILKENGYQTNGDIVLGISATRQTKMWPLKYYLELMNGIINRGFNGRILIPLSSSQQDQVIRDNMIGLELPENVQFVQEGLENLPGRLSSASVYIGNDSGIKHLCVAMGMETYTFFGPERPLEWHPYDTNKHRFFHINDLSCRMTGNEHYCGKSECVDHYCLQNIRPVDVVEKIDLPQHRNQSIR